MELLIFFKEEYDTLERETYEGICKKMFSDAPFGIGARKMTELELITFQDVLSLIDADGYENEILDDLILFHRSGNMEHVEEGGDAIVESLYGQFIRLLRVRLQNCIGLPFVINEVTGQTVEMSSIIQSEVEDAFNEVRVFNYNLAGVRLEVEGVMDKNVLKRFLDYVRRGVENDMIMYAQSIYYYDLQTDFVFDALEMRFRGKSYKWRQLLGSVSDEIFVHNPTTLWLDYSSFEDICAWKYVNKDFYKYYLHRRRIESFSKEKVIADSRLWENTAVEPVAGSVRYTGFKFWCEVHGKFNCPHVATGSPKHFTGPSNIPEQDLMYLVDCLEDISSIDRDFLIKMVDGRSFYSVFSITCLFLHSLKKFPAMLQFINDHYMFIKYGLMISLIRANTVIVDRVSKQFRFNDRVYLDTLNDYDLRNRGMCTGDRLYDRLLVPASLDRGIPVRDMEDMFEIEGNRRPKYVRFQGKKLKKTRHKIQYQKKKK